MGPPDPDPVAAARPHWRLPLIAAALTVVLVAIVLTVGYLRMRDEAKDDAASLRSGAAPSLRQAGASGPGGRSGERQRVAGARRGAGSSP